MILSLQQFEEILAKQTGETIVISHYGSFKHSGIYEKFLLVSNECEYSFKDNMIDDELELMTNILDKKDIKSIEYIKISEQLELKLIDGNRLLIDLEIEIDI
jgi:hypothetical protein